MDILPESLARQLEFFETRALAGGPWADHAGLGANQIGVTPASVEELEGLTQEARAAYDAMLEARSAAKSATQRWVDAQRAMRVKGSAMIKAIKAHSAMLSDPQVYTLARLPQPETPSTPGLNPPPMPTNVSARVRHDGAVEVRWRARAARGTSFEIWRQASDERPQRPFVLVGVATGSPGGAGVSGSAGGASRFVDESLPLNPGRQLYTVRALRLGKASPFSGAALVQFGGAGGSAGGGSAANGSGERSGLKSAA